MNTEHHEILKSGVDNWNAWRVENPYARPELSGADLSGADLRSADLNGADLRSADLNGADLRHADLRSADLRYVQLRSADLRDADLTGAYLRNANLRFANLRDANLTDANIRYTYLIETDLTDADLNGADLTGAHLRGAIGNGREVCSVTFPERTVTWTSDRIFIGCQVRTIEEWFEISDDELDEMSSVARDRWRRWEPVIKALIEAKPPVKTKA